jgi:two-component system sensor histidine kinase VanS
MFRGDTLDVLRLLFIAFREAAVVALAFLLVFGLLGGWLLAARMLAP